MIEFVIYSANPELQAATAIFREKNTDIPQKDKKGGMKSIFLREGKAF